jgi:hypothetical protein
MFLEPIKIRSPYTGETVFPTSNTYEHEGKTYEQVCYNDPITGNLIKKGIVSIKDSKTGEIIQDYKSGTNNSIRSISYRS